MREGVRIMSFDKLVRIFEVSDLEKHWDYSIYGKEDGRVTLNNIISDRFSVRHDRVSNRYVLRTSRDLHDEYDTTYSYTLHLTSEQVSSFLESYNDAKKSEESLGKLVNEMASRSKYWGSISSSVIGLFH